VILGYLVEEFCEVRSRLRVGRLNFHFAVRLAVQILLYKSRVHSVNISQKLVVVQFESGGPSH
jgi:hypothetical protein